MSDIESRAQSALRQFDANMAGIFDRAAFYQGDLYSTRDSDPRLSRLQGCFKWTLLLVNVIFLIFGAVLMSVGAYALNNQVGVLSGITLPAGITVMGVFIMLMALIGGLSAWRESRRCLGFYFVFLLIFTIILLAVGVAVYVERNQARMYISKGFQASPYDIRLSLENAFNCCGLNGNNDPWAAAPCPPAANSSNIGCLNILVTDFQSSLSTAGACGIAFSVIMIFGLIFVCYLMEGIRRKQFETERATLRQSNNVIVNVDDTGIIDATTAPKRGAVDEETDA